MSENLNPENENAASNQPTAQNATTEGAASEAAATETQKTETAATSAVVKIEGQEFPLEVAIASDDDLLKAALSPHYPSIKNAQITRQTRLGEMIVSIVKRAEHKGHKDGR